MCTLSLLVTCSNMRTEGTLWDNCVFCVQLWCHAGEDLPYDVHSPPRDRVIKPLSNMKEFSDAWGCTADSPMNPQDKCVLW
jgi:hypothetical protein